MNPKLRCLFAFWFAGFALFAGSARGQVVAVTDRATDIGFTEAYISGKVVDATSLDAFTSCIVRIEVGPAENVYDRLYEQAFTVQPSLPGVSFRGVFLGLTPGTTYHYRLSIVDIQPGGGSADGGDAVFTTLSAPTVTMLPATDIGPVSATLHAEASGPALTSSNQYLFDFLFGETADHEGGAIGVVVDASNFTPGGTLRISATTANIFAQYKTIHYALRITDLSQSWHVFSNDEVFTTDGNSAPLAHDEIGVIGGTETSVKIYSPATDPDSPVWSPSTPVPIVAVGNPGHGSVQIGGNGQWIVYTKSDDFVDTDTFPYTATDQYGASTTGNIFIVSPDRFFQMAAGTYESNLTRDDGRPAGTMRLRLDATGAFSALMDFFGQTFPFTGAFQRDSNTGTATGMVSIFDLSRHGLPPFEFSLGLNSLDGVPALNGIIHNLGSAYGVAAQTALLPSGSFIAEAGGYTAILPAVQDTSLPQGHGFSRIVVKANGSVKFAGKTGDGTPFARGTRMRRDRSVLISAKLGLGNQDRLTGGVRFANGTDTDCTGGFNWYRPQHPTGPYNGGFNYALNALGAYFAVPPRGGAILQFSDPVHPAVDFDLFDHTGTPLIASNVAIASNGSTVTTYPSGERLKLNVDRHTGVFTGTLSTPANPKHPRKFSGVIVQNQKRGAGVGGKSGEDGRVEFVAQ